MSRKKKNREYSAEFAVHVAEGFYAFGLRIAKETHTAEGYRGFAGIMPAAVNMSLALELYLKALHIGLGRKPSGHHLWKLFKNLPRETKEQIEEQYGKGIADLESKSSDEHELSVLRVTLSRVDQDEDYGDEPTSVLCAKDFFLMHDNAFEVWRYLHEFPRSGYMYEYHFGAMDIMTRIVREHAINFIQKPGSQAA